MAKSQIFWSDLLVYAEMFLTDFAALLFINRPMSGLWSEETASWKSGEPHVAFVKPLGAFSSSDCICLKFPSSLHQEWGRGLLLDWLQFIPWYHTPMLFNIYLYFVMDPNTSSSLSWRGTLNLNSGSFATNVNPKAATGVSHNAVDLLILQSSTERNHSMLKTHYPAGRPWHMCWMRE